MILTPTYYGATMELQFAFSEQIPCNIEVTLFLEHQIETRITPKKKIVSTYKDPSSKAQKKK